MPAVTKINVRLPEKVSLAKSRRISNAITQALGSQYSSPGGIQISIGPLSVKPAVEKSKRRR